MNAKTISPKQAALLQHLQRANRSSLTLKDTKAIYPSLSENAVEKMMSNMVQKGLLLRLKRGLYFVIPYEQSASAFMPNWHLVADTLTQDRKHYIAYHAAMQIHGISTQPSLKEYVVVEKPIRPATLLIKGIPFQFVYHNTVHFFGITTAWINAFEQVPCSDLEKTFIDALFRPSYAGGIIEIARALYLARERINMAQLIDYSQRFGTQAVIKRLGFLLELLGINDGVLDLLHKSRTPSFVVLDPEAPATGSYDSRWRVQQNIDPKSIKDTLFS